MQVFGATARDSKQLSSSSVKNKSLGLNLCLNHHKHVIQTQAICETREKKYFSKKERIGNSCQDGTCKTLDFSLDLG